MNQQQQALLLQVTRQLETVLAACEQNGKAEVLLGSKRHPDRTIQVKLVAEEQRTNHNYSDGQSIENTKD